MKQSSIQIVSFLVLGLLLYSCLFTKSPSNTYENVPIPSAKQADISKKAFLRAYKVFMHPRCMNCHPSGDKPLQGDDSHVHLQNVQRGEDGRGLFALKCTNCHQDKNLEGKNMPPGLKNSKWHMPPADRKMVFQGKSPRELALQFKNTEFTGFENWETDLVHHIQHDDLVKNGWSYGTSPPLSHEEFVASVKEWINNGAVLPDK
jgi:hypothetical protein